MSQRTSVLDRRFMTLDDVRAVLSISSTQAYSLVRSGELRAIRVGGRGQWRIENAELEAYIQRSYFIPAPTSQRRGLPRETPCLSAVTDISPRRVG
ncbi:helix-turn-helix domain-containing protein [Brachybacterium tyrofermentans]